MPSFRWVVVLAPLSLAVACAQGESAAVDAAVDAAIDAPIDAAIDAAGRDGPAPGNDTCAGATDISSQALMAGGVTIDGDLTDYQNDVQPPMACTGFTERGPDAIYVLTVGPGKIVTATLEPMGWDGAIALVQPCVMSPICLDGSDGASPEVATYTTTAATTLYVVVDSWSPTAFGRYRLNVTVQ